MDYKREAIEYLKNYDKLKSALDNLKDEILELKVDIKSIKAIPYSDMPKGSGCINADDELVNKMFRLSRAESEYKSTLKTVNRIDKVLNNFENNNKAYHKVLKGYFIDQYTEEQLMKDFNYSDRHIRRLKQEALRAFAIEVFGIKVIGA
ncbi:hypothetical protein [Clostridium beijerinckii]|uniref:Phage transcriptional regulator, RinA family n=1 Tax=Clostridium beijerinckii TaxID=1520 RepID=A0AAX0B176_CLOBE|nr:hypothetical protein [Clostridium beijerinckii]NRT88118.1 hypothetical protein [Clostridium beijerinckii]NYC73546.1 uncharacterized coiled-coil DUF342 family protein [Clostridium beijerinckii]